MSLGETDNRYDTIDGRLHLGGQDVFDQLHDLKVGRPCEMCNGHPADHAWVELDMNGFIVLCSNVSDTPSKRIDPDEMWTGGPYKSTDIKLGQLIDWLTMFERHGRLVKDVWEIRYLSENNTFELRIDPSKSLNMRDDNWRTCQYTFSRKY